MTYEQWLETPRGKEYYDMWHMRTNSQKALFRAGFSAGLTEGERRAMEKMDDLGEYWQGTESKDADFLFMKADCDKDDAQEYLAKPIKKVNLYAREIRKDQKDKTNY